MDADITSFFDSVPHRLLPDRLLPEVDSPRLAGLIDDWIHAWIWNGKRVRRLTRGIPQGSPLSPLLANFFLSPLDLELEKSGCRMVRYADDFLILARTPAEARSAASHASSLLKSLGLELNTRKTVEVTFDQGFTFLGAWFHGDRVFLPWRMGPKPKGRILEITRPMPARALAEWKQRGKRSNSPRWRAKSPDRNGPQPVTAKGSQFVANLYITEQGAVVRKSGERLLIEKDSRVALDLPYHRLESVLIFGNVQITAHAMGEMLEKGVTLSLFSRHGSFRGALVPPEHRNIQLRISQHDLYRDEARSLAAAASVVDAKLANCIWVLERFRARRPDGEATDRGLQALQSARSSLDGAKDHSSMLGVEGAAARAYFEALMDYNTSGFPWLGRRKHPATDPVNALLSLTYTLLTQELNGLLEAAGLEPGLGVLHEPEYGRPALALDLLEPFRSPVADRFVLALLNRGCFAQADFEQSGQSQPCHLTHDALKRYFGSWEKWMGGKDETERAPGGGYRRILREEARRFAAFVRDGGVWKPYLCEPPAKQESESSEGGEPWNTSSVTI